MKKYNWLLQVVAVLLLVFSTQLYSQPNLPCTPANQPGCGTWERRTISQHVATDAGSVSVTVTVWTRVCNGVTEFIYDDASIIPHDNGRFTENFSIYHYNFQLLESY